MNIYDVSRQAGVSIATVSRVLNGNPNVSEKTREKVLAVIRDSDYTPNIFARGLGLNTMHTIGIICCDAADLYLANCISSLEQGFRASGYDSLLCCTGYSLENKRAYLRFIVSKRVDVVVIVGSMFLESDPKDNEYILETAKDVPVFITNGTLEGENVYCVRSDDRKAVRTVVSALLDSGRKAPLFLYHSVNSQSAKEKFAGYQAACRKHRVKARHLAVPRTNNKMQDTVDILRALHDQGEDFDLIIASVDGLAVGAAKYATRHGIAMPEQLAVVGYNNSWFSWCSEPEISTIDPLAQELCAATVRNVMMLLSGSEPKTPYLLTPAFVERSTTDIGPVI